MQVVILVTCLRGRVVLNHVETIEGNMCACGMYVRTVSGHHRFKDHQANSTLEELSLSANDIGNAGACAFADAIMATHVMHGPTLSGFPRHGLFSEALSYPDVALVTTLLGERRIDRFLWLCVWPRTRESTNPHNRCGHSCG